MTEPEQDDRYLLDRVLSVRQLEGTDPVPICSTEIDGEVVLIHLRHNPNAGWLVEVDIPMGVVEQMLDVGAESSTLYLPLTREAKHRLAAVGLDREEFGFSAQDIADELRASAHYSNVAANCDLAEKATNLALAHRHRFRAARIASLLGRSDIGDQLLLPAGAIDRWRKSFSGDQSHWF